MKRANRKFSIFLNKLAFIEMITLPVLLIIKIWIKDSTVLDNIFLSDLLGFFFTGVIYYLFFNESDKKEFENKLNK